MKKILALLLVAVMSITLLTACTGAKTDSDLAYIKEKGEMVIGMTLFAPMNYEENGELTGFETDFAKAVCEKLGVTPKFQEINWDSKEIELNSKNIDCIWNGMTITEERKANMQVTAPYMNNRQVLVAKAENAEKFKTSIDGASVVAEQGSTGETLAQEDEFFKNATYTAVDSQAKGLLDVKAGTSDLVVVDYVLSIGSIGEGTDFEDLVVVDLEKEFGVDPYGVAFRKGSDTEAAVSAVIDELKADGTLDKIAEKYKLQDLLVK